MTPVRELVASQQAVDPVVLSLKDDLKDTLPEDKLGAMEIVVTEALTNIVRHAYQGAGDAPIRVRTLLTDAAVVVEIRDAAPPGPADLFDKAPNIDEIDPLAESGRGLALIRCYADRLDFAPGASGNRLRLEFDRLASP